MTTLETISLVLAIMLLFLTVKIKYDYDLKHIVQHTREWWLMFCVGIFTTFFFTYATGVPWEWHLWNLILGIAATSACMSMGFIWIFFSGVYGLKVANDFWYTGVKNNPNKAKSDKFLEKYSKSLQIIIKLTSLITPILFYILIFRHIHKWN